MTKAWYRSVRYPPAACCRLKGCSFGVALAFLELPLRTRVYVDGFNLYYGALKDTAFKWLDPVKPGASIEVLGWADRRRPSIFAREAVQLPRTDSRSRFFA